MAPTNHQPAHRAARPVSGRRDLSSPSDSGDARFSFDLRDDDAPHAPLTIHWTRGLAADVSLRDFEESTVRRAYASFLERFDRLTPIGGGAAQ